MYGSSNPQTLPILPLPKGYVLLPGVTLRIPVVGRSDVLALLTAIYSRSKSPRPDAASVPIGCVPLRSPLLSSDGQQLIGSKAESGQDHESHARAPEKASKEDLFAFGTVAKISGVQGRRLDEMTLVVEGLRRFRIAQVTKEKPFFEATVAYVEDDGKHDGARGSTPIVANMIFSCRPG